MTQSTLTITSLRTHQSPQRKVIMQAMRLSVLFRSLQRMFMSKPAWYLQNPSLPLKERFDLGPTFGQELEDSFELRCPALTYKERSVRGISERPICPSNVTAPAVLLVQCNAWRAQVCPRNDNGNDAPNNQTTANKFKMILSCRFRWRRQPSRLLFPPPLPKTSFPLPKLPRSKISARLTFRF